ncbi:MAG: exodeoxyribonuclease-3, partial [Myxococcota bacterium]
GFTSDERESFTRILDAGFVDTFRHFNPGKAEAYSWWSVRGDSRARNVGWRLDYFCVSQGFMGQVAQSSILTDVHGSDHCPVELVTH